MAAKIIQQRVYKRLGLFYAADDWGADFKTHLTTDLRTLGIEVVGSAEVGDQWTVQSAIDSVLPSKPDAVYLGTLPDVSAALIDNWILNGGTRKMVLGNTLRSIGFLNQVTGSNLAETIGHDLALARTESASSFQAMYQGQYGSAPQGPGIANSFDATMIALLAMDAAADMSGASIAAQIKNITDTEGVPVFPNMMGFLEARHWLQHRVKFTLGLGTRAASLAIKSKGSKIT